MPSTNNDLMGTGTALGPPINKHVPDGYRYFLEPLANQAVHPDHAPNFYQADLLEASNKAASNSIAASDQNQLEGTALGTAQDNAPYGCPWCGAHMKLAKDFIRHVKQKCSCVEEYRCPEHHCQKTFCRKDRFVTHRKKIHNQESGMGLTALVRRSTVRLKQQQTLGCGFCHQFFRSDLHGFLKHLIRHYRQGATLSGWSARSHVPTVRQFAPEFSPDLPVQGASRSDNAASAPRVDAGVTGEVGNLSLFADFLSSDSVVASINESVLQG